MRRQALFALFTLPLLISANDAPGSLITPDSVRGHVEFLADDALEGRETGKRGYNVAAAYVAGQYRRIGLAPLGGQSWFQTVPFAGTLLDNAKSSVTIAGQNFANRKDVLLSPARVAGEDGLEADVVFAGYGIDDLRTGRNDYAGLDVKGKFVAVLHGFPKGMKSDQGAHYGRTKGQAAQAHGALGVINIRTKERERIRPWAREIEGPGHPTLNWSEADGSVHSDASGIKATITLHDTAASALFNGARVPLAKILNEADKKGGRPKGFALKQKLRFARTTSVSTLSSPNVIGVLPGSDPALANEYVLLMAHLDHNGVEENRTGDKIFNGAMDNASGTASMLEAARALAAQPNRPRRSIIFAAVTAEERGLLGSDYLAHHVPVPAGGKVVGVVNLDMPILLYDFVDVVAFGAEHSTMGQAVAKAGAQMGVALSPDPLPSEGLFTRSDHYSFVKKGVPAIFLMTGFQNGGEKAFQDFLKTHYHKVSDDLTLPIDWNAAAKFARLNMLIAAEIANSDAAPRWYQGSFFGDIFAPNAPRATVGG